VLFVACSDPPPAPSVPNGTLAITFNNAQIASDFEGNVLVTGPNGFNKTIKRSEGISVAPGTYNVTANVVRQGGAVVDRAFEGEVSTLIDCCETTQDVVMTSNQTVPVSVSYDSSENSGLLRLVGKALAIPVTSTVLEAGIGNALPSRQVCDQDARGAALDAKFNLWVSCADSATLRKFTRLDFNPPQLRQTIALPVGTQARGVAFDRQGNLWVVDAGALDRVIGYAKKDLDLNLSGSLEPFATITVPENSDTKIDVDQPEAITFDAQGNLWVSTFTSDDSLLKFDATTLTQNPKPSVVINFKSAPFPGVNFSLFTPKSIAFDKDGNLWASNNVNKTIVKFTPPFTTSKQQPVLMLTDVGTNLGAIAFDNTGALWVSATGQLLKFSADKLLLTGAIKVSPDVTLGVDLGANASASASVFAPAPTNLPLSQ
jgi:streptogramin lyase